MPTEIRNKYAFKITPKGKMQTAGLINLFIRI